MTVCLVAALAVAPLVHAAGTASPIAFVVSPIPDQTISSIAELFVGVTPSVTVSNMAISAELTLGTDYTVTYTDNKSIGSACAVVAGCGEYAAYTNSATFVIGGLDTYYIVSGTDPDPVYQSTISGESSTIGWSTTKGGSKSANGITADNALYSIWTDRSIRTPNKNYATPSTSAIVIEPSCRWTLGDKMMNHTLTLSNLIVRAGGKFVVDVWDDGGSSYRNTYAGNWMMEEDAVVTIHAAETSDSTVKEPTLSASVAGRGAIVMSNTIDSGNTVPAQTFTPYITGDLSGFKGDLIACNIATNGTTSLVLELVNALSIPGDPDPGRTAYVVVTNGAKLVVNHDWVSPKNRVWVFGDGKRPTIDVAEGKTLTINGTVTGSSGFNKAGLGTLVITKVSPGISGHCNVLSGKVVLKGSAQFMASNFRRKSSISLPEGYTMLESLSLAGGATTSYIDTGFTPTDGHFGFVFDYSLGNAPGSSGGRVMGSAVRNIVWEGGTFIGSWTRDDKSSGQFLFGEVKDIPVVGGQVANSRMRMSLMNGSAELSRGWRQHFGTTSVRTSASGFCGSVYLGNVHTGSMADGQPATVYRFMVFDGDTLVHDFIPVMNPSGTVGIYDTVGNLGFRNARDAQYCTPGAVYNANSDDQWIEVDSNTGLILFVR